MKPGIYISDLWADDDIAELQVSVSDGKASFSNKVYVGHKALEDNISSLLVFRKQMHGGLFDLRFGEFGPEYASGAFHARFHFAIPGRLFVSCSQESEFVEFANRKVASRATMYLKSEPALLDRFIGELQVLATGTNARAFLEAI